MTKTKCPRCQTLVQPGAHSCGFCRAPLSPPSIPASSHPPTPSPARPTPVATIADPLRATFVAPTGPPICPSCRMSDAAVAVPMLHAEGQSSGAMSGMTYGMGSGVGFYGGGVRMQSAISRRLSPPPRRNGAIGLLIGTCVLGTIGLGFLIGSASAGNGQQVINGLMFTTAAVAMGVAWNRMVDSDNRFNAVTWPQQVEAWRRSFVCRRCNVLWDPVLRTSRPLV